METEKNTMAYKYVDPSAVAAKEAQYISEKRETLQSNPFDPRTEVSADARKIVFHMWIIFVLLPVVLCILFAIVK